MTDTYPLSPYKSNPADFHNKQIPPGRLQYKETINVLRGMNVDFPDAPETSEPWHIQENTEELTRILTPNTRCGRKPRRLLFCIKRIGPLGHCLKGMLQDQTTGEIALLTALCCPTYDHKIVPSTVDGWRISHAKMIAPLMFWRGVKNISNLID